MNNPLKEELTQHWKSIRSRTYDILDGIQDADLQLRLPFPDSETLGYQFACMFAMSDSIASGLAGGDFSDHDEAFRRVKLYSTVAALRQAMNASDILILAAIEQSEMFKNGETSHTPLHLYLYLVEHEAHHHGQIINFICTPSINTGQLGRGMGPFARIERYHCDETGQAVDSHGWAISLH